MLFSQKQGQNKMDTNICFICLIAVFIQVSEQKSWLFAVSGNRRPFNFIDTDGYLKGADVEMIEEVCKIAGEKCEVTVQPFDECVRTYNGRFYPGRGLMAGWFDACVNFVSSVDRVNSLTFTNKIREAFSKFAVYKGNPKGFDPNNVSESTIVHLNGAYANEQCMVRIGLGRPKRIIVAATIDEAKALMLNKTGDALFSQRSSFSELDVIPTDYHCDINGTGMMVKKGSPLPGWWNPAFDKYYKSGAYSTNCEGANKRFGGFPVIQSCLSRPSNIPAAGVFGKR